MEENEEEIDDIRKNIISRNPLAFETKLKVIEKPLDEVSEKINMIDESKNAHHAKGWNWRKSQWSNNYWECHQFGAKCTDLCAWTDWKN